MNHNENFFRKIKCVFVFKIYILVYKINFNNISESHIFNEVLKYVQDFDIL